MRALRGGLSAGEFAAAVRRAAREIGEHVSCDARYVGRIESGEIRCPNYAYERVFRHMFPGSSLEDLGFASRTEARRRPAHHDEENDDVQRRTFLAGAPMALAAAVGLDAPAHAGTGSRVGAKEVRDVEEAVRRIRLWDDAHGGDSLFDQAGQALRAAYRLLNFGSYTARTEQRLQSGAGELAISVGWLAHDSGHWAEARSFYAEALATARMADDPALEAHSFCNSAFLARDAGRPREAVRAAQAARSAATGLGSERLLALLALREAGGWAVLGDRRATERALLEAHRHYARGAREADPDWMSFFNDAEVAGLEAQCWSALGEWDRAVDQAEQAIALQPVHFVRNRALYTAELAHDWLGRGELAAAAATGRDAVALLTDVHSTRIRRMLATTAESLRQHGAVPEVRDFLQEHDLVLAG
ncbi:tetratricopeptide repeat protein [Streptacidiphilus monticola]